MYCCSMAKLGRMMKKFLQRGQVRPPTEDEETCSQSGLVGSSQDTMPESTTPSPQSSTPVSHLFRAVAMTSTPASSPQPTMSQPWIGSGGSGRGSKPPQAAMGARAKVPQAWQATVRSDSATVGERKPRAQPLGLTRTTQCHQTTQTREQLDTVPVRVICLTSLAIPPSQRDRDEGILHLYAARSSCIRPGRTMCICTDLAIELPPGIRGNISAANRAVPDVQRGVMRTTIPPCSLASIEVTVFNYCGYPVNVYRGDILAVVSLYREYKPLLEILGRDGHPVRNMGEDSPSQRRWLV